MLNIEQITNIPPLSEDRPAITNHRLNENSVLFTTRPDILDSLDPEALDSMVAQIGAIDSGSPSVIEVSGQQLFARRIRDSHSTNTIPQHVPETTYHTDGRVAGSLFQALSMSEAIRDINIQIDGVQITMENVLFGLIIVNDDEIAERWLVSRYYDGFYDQSAFSEDELPEDDVVEAFQNLLGVDDPIDIAKHFIDIEIAFHNVVLAERNIIPRDVEIAFGINEEGELVGVAIDTEYYRFPNQIMRAESRYKIEEPKDAVFHKAPRYPREWE